MVNIHAEYEYKTLQMQSKIANQVFPETENF